MSHLLLIILGFSIIFIATTLGAATIYLFKNNISQKINTLFLGFAGGIMVAASIWSLIIPSISQSEENMGKLSFIPAAIGIILGGLFLVVLDKIIPHFHKGTNEEEGPHVKIDKSIKLFLAVTIHNIPEGLAVGFAFGSASLINTDASYISALGLAIGIAIQNFPEGAAVSLPLEEIMHNKNKSFLFGMGSGAVEPVAAIIGFFLAKYLTFLQPWLLSFAAGAMLFVVAEDLIPDAKIEKNPHLGTWGFIIGFVLMMVLDVALG